MSNLYQASHQWATRPDDERFETLEQMIATTRHHAESARQATVKMRSLRCEVTANSNLALIGPTGQPARLTHWSFGQLTNRLATPPAYLRTLPPEMSASLINYGLQSRAAEDSDAKLLVHANGDMICRAVTSDAYARIWNYEVLERLQNLTNSGWQVPPARPARDGQAGARKATAADVLRLSSGRSSLAIKVGDMIAPAGLYASDHDCFCFLVNESIEINDGSDGGLCRGVFVSNSEVGASSLKITQFLYRFTCGNHIVWGAKQVKELRIVHRGKADETFGRRLVAEVRQHAEQGAIEDQRRVDICRRFEISDVKRDVLDKLFSRKIAPMKTLELAWDHAERDYDETHSANPRTAWGMAQGLTHLSQQTSYADERDELDRAAGKVLEMAF